jgi:hypothetical protein
MFGQGCLLPDDPEYGEPDFCVWDGVVGVVGVVVVDAVEALDSAPVVPVVVLLVVLGEAAPATAAAPPPVASAPATIVAPSSFEMCIVEPPGGMGCVSLTIVRAHAKRPSRGV